MNYSVAAVRVNKSKPILSPNNSVFKFNYNPSLFTLPNGKDVLLVRCQAVDSNGNALPSVLAISEFKTPLKEYHLDYIEMTPICECDIVFSPETERETFGTEDPRVVYDSNRKEYHMLYSAVQANPMFSRLALATSKDPSDSSKWVRHGTLYEENSKSGAAILINEKKNKYAMVWGDHSLTYTTSEDLLNFKEVQRNWLTTRSEKFDSFLVESGPPPIRLSDGNFFFVYNSARRMENGQIQYNAGYLVLDKDNPQTILQRSDIPILSPDLDWEKQGLVPNVVFVEGMKKIKHKNGEDKFLIAYGAGDSNIGAALVTVSYCGCKKKNISCFGLFNTLKMMWKGRTKSKLI